MRTYSNGTPGKDKVLSVLTSSDSILYRLKDEVLCSLFTVHTGCACLTVFLFCTDSHCSPPICPSLLYGHPLCMRDTIR